MSNYTLEDFESLFENYGFSDTQMEIVAAFVDLMLTTYPTPAYEHDDRDETQHHDLVQEFCQMLSSSETCEYINSDGIIDISDDLHSLYEDLQNPPHEDDHVFPSFDYP